MQNRYPRDIFESLWGSVEQLAATDAACICEVVLRELARGDDGLHPWAQGLDGFVCKATDEELITVAEIARDHPGWVQGQKNDGDPFIIAHAKHSQRVVVTEEARKGPGTIDKNQKIPNIADEHGVECLNLFDLMRDQGWRF